MHGSFSRADTWNNMAAIGPDFSLGHFIPRHVDHKPVSNADLAVTIAHLLGLNLPREQGMGRVIEESIVHGSRDKAQTFYGIEVSNPGSLGPKTVLVYQSIGDERYYDKACFSSDPKLKSQSKLNHPIRPDPCP